MPIPSSFSSILFLFLLLLFFSGHGSEARRLVRGGETVANSRRGMLEMRSLIPGSTCSPPPTAPAGSVPLLHRQGPCSPWLLPRNLTLRFLRDQSRVNSFRDSLASSSPSSSPTSSNDMNDPTGDGSDLSMPVKAPSVGAGEYAAIFGLGTPKQDLPLILDTGSSQTWTQCLACSTSGSCFDPDKSTTYSKPPCSRPSCNYSVSYRDKSYSIGYYARDTLTLSANYQFKNFIFGCAEDTGGFGNYAGILGLAQGDRSFIQQTDSPFGADFCYCIPPKDSSQGYLLFGLGALEHCQTGKSTNILPDSTQYYVKLLGITIGDRRLDFSELAPSSSPSKTTLDSGTTISRLPRPVYSALQDEFNKQMSGHTVASRLSLPGLELDACYDLEGHESVALQMALNFDGVDVSLDPTGVVWRQTDSQVCLAFAANEKEDDPIIIGSTQQRNLNILFNVKEKRIEFGDGSCGN